MCPHALYVSSYHYYYNHSLEDESREFPKGQTANLMILAMLDGLKAISLEDWWKMGAVNLCFVVVKS
jgi:hypothetical protein